MAGQPARIGHRVKNRPAALPPGKRAAVKILRCAQDDTIFVILSEAKDP